MHAPVLLEETIRFLITDPTGIYVDGTLGGGGHSREILKNLDKKATLLAFDKDRDILEQTRSRIPCNNIRYFHKDFKFLQDVLQKEKIESVQGIVLDLGVSSFQLDETDRGFTYHEPAPLDMRMNRDQALTAAHIINTFGEQELADLFYRYGEETHSRKIAREVVKRRQEQPINTTLELVEIIKAVVPAAYKRKKHPARKVFQALRIEVNQELEALQSVLPQAVDALKPGGRLCIISFHSLEDRMVKRYFQQMARECVCPPAYPVCTCDQKPGLKVITRRPVEAGREELEKNPRARSARLRVAEKI